MGGWRSEATQPRRSSPIHADTPAVRLHTGRRQSVGVTLIVVLTDQGGTPRAAPSLLFCDTTSVYFDMCVVCVFEFFLLFGGDAVRLHGEGSKKHIAAERFWKVGRGSSLNWRRGETLTATGKRQEAHV